VPVTPFEEAIAAEVAKMLTGRAKPRIRVLLSVGPDGVIGNVHVSIEMHPRPAGEPCEVVALLP
jgi:hypothetical protein